MIAKLTYDESLARATELTRAIDRVSRAARTGSTPRATVVDAVEAAIAFPCTLHHFDPTDLFDELYVARREAGRYEAAIDAKYRAIEVGYRSQPDPEADIAECLLLAERRSEGDALFAELRRRDPMDEYLYNSAGWAYAAIGDHEEALRWLRDGIEVAIANGDYDRIAGQLLDMAQRSLQALGRPTDVGLEQRVRAFERQWTRPPYTGRSAGGVRPPIVACDVCEFDPATPPSQPPAVPTVASTPTPRASTPALACAWFDREQWPLACERWPNLLDDCPADHTAYSHRLEGLIKAMANVAPGTRLAVASVTLEAIDAHAEEMDRDAGEASVRAEVAAKMSQAGEVIPWPPARNDPCWCGSGVKYKRCCNPNPAAFD